MQHVKNRHGTHDAADQSFYDAIKNGLACILHKDRRKRPENAMNADSERSEAFEEQRKKDADILKYFEGSF